MDSLQQLKNVFTSLHYWRVWIIPHAMLGASIEAFGISWQAVAAAFIFYTLISGLGVAVGFHRFFSHKSFKTSRLWEQLMLYFGCLACHGNPLFWVALHNGLHHRYSDTEKDVHSPVAHGWWQAYQGYAFDPQLVDKVPMRAASTFLRHSDWMWAVNHYHKVLYATWAIVGIIAFRFDMPWLFIGLVAAQTWAIHQEAVVNVLGHVSGFGAYRVFNTDDHSVNRNWLALITWGQSLHNTHHAHPIRYDFAALPDEFDPSTMWVNMIKTK